MLEKTALMLGLISMASSGALAGLGTYDGVLSPSPVDTLPSSNQPVAVTLRVIVTGGHQDARDTLDTLLDQATIIPTTLEPARFDTGGLVPVQLQNGPHADLVLARFAQDTPVPGELLVTDALLTVHYALVVGPDGAMTGYSVAILDIQDHHAPLLF